MTRAELLAAAKPILFNTEMVRAILEGRKTVTRRKIDAKSAEAVLSSPARIENPELSDQQFIERLCTAPCEAGNILWVRETFSPVGVKPIRYLYKCFCPEAEGLPVRWRPSIHMPKEAARLFLRVKSVRVERLQDITEDGALAEGVPCEWPMNEVYCPVCEGEGLIGAFNSGSLGYFEAECPHCEKAISRFKNLWNSTIEPADLSRYGWETNPWVRVIEFERVTADETNIGVFEL